MEVYDLSIFWKIVIIIGLIGIFLIFILCAISLTSILKNEDKLYNEQQKNNVISEFDDFFQTFEKGEINKKAPYENLLSYKINPSDKIIINEV